MARYDFATHRLFVTAPLTGGAAVGLDAGQMNYLINVLRMQAGARVLAFNGRDGEWLAEVEMPTRKTAVLRLLEQRRPQPPAGNIGYAFAPLKSARLDYVVQKAVEMGASIITPVITQRTQMHRLNPDKLAAHVIEAAEQCGILAMPEVAAEIRLSAWLAALPGEHLLIFADEDAPVADPVSALSVHKGCSSATVLIGPEGGFTEDERALLHQHHVICRLSLGPRILRADTAGVAALALVQAVIGDGAGGL